MTERVPDQIDFLTMSILLGHSKKLLTATVKSWISDRAWQYYLEHKTEENHKRFITICNRLYK